MIAKDKGGAEEKHSGGQAAALPQPGQRRFYKLHWKRQAFRREGFVCLVTMGRARKPIHWPCITLKRDFETMMEMVVWRKLMKGGIKIIFASSCKSIWKQKHLGSFAAATADEALLSCYQILLTKKNIWVRYLNCYEHVYPGQFSMTNSLPQWMQSILPMNGLHTFHSVLLFFINTCCCLILASSRRLWSSESEHPWAELAMACWQQHWPMTVFKFSICTCKHSETRFKSDFQLVW